MAEDKGSLLDRVDYYRDMRANGAWDHAFTLPTQDEYRRWLMVDTEGPGQVAQFTQAHDASLWERFRMGVRMWQDGTAAHPFTMPTGEAFYRHQVRDTEQVLTEIVAAGQPARSQEVTDPANTWWVREALERHQARLMAIPEQVKEQAQAIREQQGPARRQTQIDRGQGMSF